MAIFSKRRIKRGKLLVKGSDKIVIETPFRPTEVQVEFLDDDPVSKFPSHDDPSPDWVKAKLFADLDGEDKYGVEISWKVAGKREISWAAKK